MPPILIRRILLNRPFLQLKNSLFIIWKTKIKIIGGVSVSSTFHPPFLSLSLSLFVCPMPVTQRSTFNVYLSLTSNLNVAWYGDVTLHLQLVSLCLTQQRFASQSFIKSHLQSLLQLRLWISSRFWYAVVGFVATPSSGFWSHCLRIWVVTTQPIFYVCILSLKPFCLIMLNCCLIHPPN